MKRLFKLTVQITCAFSMLAALTLIGSLNNVAFAGAIADKQAWDSAQKEIDSEKAFAEKRCGGKLSITIDKASFKDPEALKTASWCKEYIGAVGRLCDLSDMKDSKPDILKAVTSVTCHYDAKLNHEELNGNKFVKKGTSFDASFNKDSANISDNFMNYLKKEL